MVTTREDLPENVDALKAALLTERARAARVEAELAVAKAKASDDQALIAHQQLQIAKLTRQACTQGKRTQHGTPQCVIRDDQPDAREGQAGRAGVAERPVVPMKLGNAGSIRAPTPLSDRELASS
jgi:hypothetical protein